MVIERSPDGGCATVLFDLVNGLAGHNAVLDAVLLFAAGPLIYVVGAAGALVALLHMRHQDRTANLWTAGQGAAALALAFAVNRLLRALAIHERPFQTRQVNQLVEHEPGVSFPSNHATAALAVAFIVGLLISARWGWILAAPAALVAISRVFVGVHWPSDIICAGIVGLLSTLLVRWAGERLRDRVEQRRELADATMLMPVPGPDAETVVMPRVRATRGGDGPRSRRVLP